MKMEWYCEKRIDREIILRKRLMFFHIFFFHSAQSTHIQLYMRLMQRKVEANCQFYV